MLAPKCSATTGWPTAAAGATQSAGYGLGREGTNSDFEAQQDGQSFELSTSSLVPTQGGVAKGTSSLDRFLQMLAADDTKKVML